MMMEVQNSQMSFLCLPFAIVPHFNTLLGSWGLELKENERKGTIDKLDWQENDQREWPDLNSIRCCRTFKHYFSSA